MAYDPNDKADKKIIDDLIKAALAEQAHEHEQDIAGLKTKNTELLGKLAKAEKGENNASEVARLETLVEENQTKLRSAEKDLKTANTNLQNITKAYETESQITHSLLVDNGLTEALVKANVASHFLPAVKAMLSSKVELKADGTNRVAVVGDKPLGEFIATWSQGDEGKHYVVAASNGGGGANGNKVAGQPGGKTILRSEYEANPGNFAKDFATGATLVDG
jgi:hypothetical protein